MWFSVYAEEILRQIHYNWGEFQPFPQAGKMSIKMSIPVDCDMDYIYTYKNL